MVSQGEGLRDRRRRETRREIHRAALRLAREHGFDKVTVEMISGEAGVSPRTFFNYFPGKEAAVVAGPPELPTDLVAEFTAAGPADPRAVLVDLTRLLVAGLADSPPQRHELHDTFALAHSHPGLHAALLAGFDRFRQSIAAAVAMRLGQPADEAAPNLLAEIALAAMRTGLERWAHGDPASGDHGAEDTPIPSVERSVALLHTLMAPDAVGPFASRPQEPEGERR